MRVSKPGRIQAKIPATTVSPLQSTGGNQTYRGPVRPLSPQGINPNVLPLTVQRQQPVNPLKPQRFR
jgi:hypothetical protein